MDGVRAFGIENELALHKPIDPEISEAILASRVIERIPAVHKIYDMKDVVLHAIWMHNGSKAYIDNGSICEFATPECTSVEDLIAVEAANLRMASAAVRGDGVRVYKLNQDASTMLSRGAHENYQIHVERLPKDMRICTPKGEYATIEMLRRINMAVLPFLITRQLYTGSGGFRFRERRVQYVLSQRTPCISQLMEVGTLNARPILNTREESHADSSSLRLHVIAGDANMSEHATALKVGGMLWALDLLEEGMLPRIEVYRPVRTIHAVNRDLTGRKQVVELADGTRYSALEIQEMYLERMLRLRDRRGPGPYDAHLDRLVEMIGLLREHDPLALYQHCDHALKHELLRTYVFDKGLGMRSRQARAVHLGYHWLDPQGLFQKIAPKLGHHRVIDDARIEGFVGKRAKPPATRAQARTRLLQRLVPSGQSLRVSWNFIEDRHVKYIMPDPCEDLVYPNHEIPAPLTSIILQ